jgi:hypothetical protein
VFIVHWLKASCTSTRSNDNDTLLSSSLCAVAIAHAASDSSNLLLATNQ